MSEKTKIPIEPWKTRPHDPVTTPAPWQPSPTGLTKREYFAALAMQNLQNVLLRDRAAGRLQALKIEMDTTAEGAIAWFAVKQADALIEELNR